MKKVLVLGSTGSIGLNTLEIIRKFPIDFEITGLSVNQNTGILNKQIEEFHPEAVVVCDKLKAAEFKKIFAGKCEILTGNEGLIEIAQRGNYDIIVCALVGFAGLAPTIEAIKLKKRIALANKETLVTAGEFVKDMCVKFGAEIIPIDSEHSAIFQCLVGEDHSKIKKIILTASGGPFLNKYRSEFQKITVAEALDHPNWKMGSKITIDSATMMNKGFEVIEAFWLFNLPKEQIEIIVHPQSIIHSMVEFQDGCIKAQLSLPDMKLPILYALTYPERYKYDMIKTDFKKIGSLTFFEPDFNKFRCLKIAYDVIGEGGTAPCILNAANEISVAKFLAGKIKFTQISELIEDALNSITNNTKADLESIIESDKKTRDYLSQKYK
jgi:1-deoxy-D-xylulose-5-phosphate reductoisomerase